MRLFVAAYWVGLASGVRCKPLWVDGFLRYLSCDFEFHLAGLDDIHSCG